MNEDFISRDWGDSFPLYPATRQAVDELLKGTCLPPDHLVCDLPPGFGLATVEKIAINAAMAGAMPGCELPDTTSWSPVASVTLVGYQRPAFMFSETVAQVSVAGS